MERLNYGKPMASHGNFWPCEYSTVSKWLFGNYTFAYQWRIQLHKAYFLGYLKPNFGVILEAAIVFSQAFRLRQKVIRHGKHDLGPWSKTESWSMEPQTSFYWNLASVYPTMRFDTCNLQDHVMISHGYSLNISWLEISWPRIANQPSTFILSGMGG
jgi:hypothetical protein